MLPRQWPNQWQPTLRFHGRDANTDWNRQLLAAIEVILVERRQHLNLVALDGITVGFNLDSALATLVKRRNVPSVHEQRVAHQRHTVAAGCVIGVMRRKRFLSHVVLDATYLTQLVDDPCSESCAANIVAHELAHVAVSRWLTKPAWSYVFPTQRSDWRHETLRYMTLNLWDEYAACRLSARIGSPFAVAINFINCFHSQVAHGLPTLRLGLRKNWQVSEALNPFVRAVGSARKPLLSAAYLMGHIDGLGIETNVATLCTAARTSPMSDCWMPLHHALRSVWERSGATFDFEALDGLTPVLMDSIRICGGERILL